MSKIKEVEIEGFERIVLDSNLSESRVTKVSDNEYQVRLAGKNFVIDLEDYNPNTREFSCKVDGVTFKGKGMTDLDLLVDKLGFRAKSKSNAKEIKAPMPGLVLDILTAVGEEKEPGDNILILEAMKMENILKAEGEGKVVEILVKKGDSVQKGQLLVRFD